jgi:HEAT repeat protein
MEDYTELIRTLQAYDWGKSGAPLLVVDAEIRKVLGHPERTAKLEAALLEVLRSNASNAAKRGVCKSLSLIATGRSAPTLAAMLTVADTSDMARYVLERMPPGAADAVLLDSIPKTTGRSRVGVVNSIGNRGNSQAVTALAGLLADSDEATAQASACALGKIGGAAAIRALASQRNAARARVRSEVLDAYLVCAVRLAAQGSKSEAAVMYRELDSEGVPPPIRKAAARALQAG